MRDNPYDYIRLAIFAGILLAYMIWAVRGAVHDIIIRIKLRKYRPRFAPGHCAGCGYDMRASPERCPECGRAQATLKPPPNKLL